jgi:DNA-directed RNA polymerase beta subunit
MNKASLDRGMFNTTYFKTHKDGAAQPTVAPYCVSFAVLHITCTGTDPVPNCPAEEKKNSTDLMLETFMKANLISRKENFDAIGDDGLPLKGKKVKEGDVLISKGVPIKAGADGITRYKDASYVVPVGDGGIIDEVVTNINGDGYKCVKVRLRKERVPMIGDKFNSRHGIHILTS